MDNGLKMTRLKRRLNHAMSQFLISFMVLVDVLRLDYGVTNFSSTNRHRNTEIQRVGSFGQLVRCYM